MAPAGQQRQVRSVRRPGGETPVLRNVRRRPDSSPASDGGINLSDSRPMDIRSDASGSDIHSAGQTDAKSGSDTRPHRGSARDVAAKLKHRGDVDLNQFVINTNLEKPAEAEGSSKSSKRLTPGKSTGEPPAAPLVKPTSDRISMRTAKETPPPRGRGATPSGSGPLPAGSNPNLAASSSGKGQAGFAGAGAFFKGLFKKKPAPPAETEPEAEASKPAEETPEQGPVVYRRRSQSLPIFVLLGLLSIAVALVVVAVIVLSK